MTCDFKPKVGLGTLQVLATQLYEALGSLVDYQNGCPLPKYEKGWGEAMKDSRKAMQDFERFFGPEPSAQDLGSPVPNKEAE